MKEKFKLIADVRINETEDEYEYLESNEVLSIEIDTKKSTNKYFVFKALTAKDEIEFKIYFTGYEKKYNGMDKIRIINPEKFLVTYEKNHCFEKDTFNLVHIDNYDIYVGEKRNDFFALIPGDSLLNEMKIKNLKCEKKEPEYLEDGTESFANYLLFYSLDNTVHSSHYYYFDNKGIAHTTCRLAIEKEYNIIKADC